MPRRTSLTEKEKGKIMNMCCNGKSIDDAAAALERSKKIVWTSIRAPEKCGKAKRSGRSSKFSAADKRISSCDAHKEKKSAGQLYQDLCLPIGKK